MDLNTEIIATRTNFQGDDTFAPSTYPQQQKLAICFQNAGIKDRDDRIAILRLWTGIKQIKTSKNLTLHVASQMIEYLCVKNGGLSTNGLLFLTFASFAIEAQPTH